jgi:tetratricopeptide (TPR) repeat protein
VYLIANAAVVQCDGRHAVEFATTCRTGRTGIVSLDGRWSGEVGLGDRFRTVQAVFAERPGLYAAEDFLFHAQPAPGGADVRVDLVPGGRLRVLPPLLAAWHPPSRQQAEKDALHALDRFFAGARLESVGVIAPAGTGKTYLVQRLRRAWADHAVQEVLLDGSLENSDQELALSLLRSLVPAQHDVFRLDEGMVEKMLARLGVPAPLARRGAELLSAEAGSGRGASVRELGQLLAQVLAARSERQPIAVIVEDLHKAFASALALLQELLDALRRLGKGRVLVVFSARDVPDRGDADLAAIWESHLRELCGERTTVVKLASLDAGEAVELLRASVPTLAEHQAVSIIGQVGRTPFALREALALLREQRDLRFDERLGEHVLVRPEGLEEAIDSHHLREPTRWRLEILRGRLPSAAWELLESAACLGKFFDVATAGPAGARLEEVYAAIGEYQRLEILTVRGLRTGQAAFDHDLVRRVVLERMGAVRQRLTAERLYRHTAPTATPGLAASLAYQAGLAEECHAHACALAREVGARGRAADAAAALALAITVVDDNLAQKVVNLSPRARANADDAIAVALPCVIAGWTTSRRQEELLTLLMEYIRHLADVMGSGSQLLDRALTEAEMLAVVRRDLFRRAQLVGYRGRQDFIVDRCEASVEWHSRAEEMLRQVPDAPAVRAERAENLIRLAIGLRQLRRLDESRAVLRDALRLRTRDGWGLLLKVLANWGASYFQSDWTRVRHYWERAERVAERRNRPDRYVHMLIDVGHLDLLEDRHDAAHERLLRAEALAEDHGYENSLLRVHLNLGCLHLVQGAYAAARYHLLKAEQLGVENRLPRRLWRARANLATLFEAMGDFKQAYAWDVATLQTLGILPDAPGAAPRDGHAAAPGNSRQVMALANLVLRSRDSPIHAQLVESLGTDTCQGGMEMAERVRQGVELPGLRDRHCKEIGPHRRFVITE